MVIITKLLEAILSLGMPTFIFLRPNRIFRIKVQNLYWRLNHEPRQIEEESSNSDGIKEEQSVTALLESSQITKAGIDDDDDDDVSVPLNPREKYEDSRDKLLSIEQKVILLEERMEQLENTQKTLRQLITNNCTCIGALLYSWALMKQFILKHITFFFVTLFLAIVISFIVGLHYVANMSRP